MNPVERIRMIEEVSQEKFASQLGYPNKGQYCYHMRNFTEDVIDKIKIAYNRDITMDIINHLKYKCRELHKQLKHSRSDSKPKSSERSINSIIDKI